MPRKPGLVPQRNRFTEHERQLALTELALSGGNCGLAERRLAARGVNHPGERTLRDWKTRHADQYEKAVELVQGKISEFIARDQEEIALRTAPVVIEAVEATRRQIAEGKCDRPSTAARDLATVTGIAVDKGQLLRNRPTQIVESRNAEEILRRLQELAPDAIKVEPIDGTATEIAHGSEP